MPTLWPSCPRRPGLVRDELQRARGETWAKAKAAATAGFGAGAFVALRAGIEQLWQVEIQVLTEPLREAAGAAGEAASRVP
ncbi:MAG: hypothetical protein ACRDYZ_08895 [Acidimicrobiales bacterium]